MTCDIWLPDEWRRLSQGCTSLVRTVWHWRQTIPLVISVASPFLICETHCYSRDNCEWTSLQDNSAAVGRPGLDCRQRSHFNCFPRSITRSATGRAHDPSWISVTQRDDHGVEQVSLRCMRYTTTCCSLPVPVRSPRTGLVNLSRFR